MAVCSVTERVLPHWPRGLSRLRAAAYIGVTPQAFMRMVHDGRMPKPKKIDAAVRWDKLAVDRAFDMLFDIETNLAGEEVYEFSAGPSANERLSIEERRRLPNWGLSQTDPTTWLTEEEAAVWMEEYRQERKERKASASSSSTARQRLRCSPQ